MQRPKYPRDQGPALAAAREQQMLQRQQQQNLQAFVDIQRQQEERQIV